MTKRNFEVQTKTTTVWETRSTFSCRTVNESFGHFKALCDGALKAEGEIRLLEIGTKTAPANGAFERSPKGTTIRAALSR